MTDIDLTTATVWNSSWFDMNTASVTDIVQYALEVSKDSIVNGVRAQEANYIICPDQFFDAILTAMIERGRQQGIEEAAKVAEEWADNYPVEVFSPLPNDRDGIGPEVLVTLASAQMGRHSAGEIARRVRELGEGE